MMRNLDGPRRRDRKSTRLNSSHTVIYTLSLHDALPILELFLRVADFRELREGVSERSLSYRYDAELGWAPAPRSEEHTSELQSHSDLHSFPTRRSSDLGTLSPRCRLPRVAGRRKRAFAELSL